MKAMSFDPGESAITATRKFCGASMASACSSSPSAIEVLLHHGGHAGVRRRRTCEEMIAGGQPAQNWEST